MKKLIYYFLAGFICATPIFLRLFQNKILVERHIDISPFCLALLIIAVLIMSKLSSSIPKNKIIVPMGIGVGYTLNFLNKWIFYPLLTLAILLIAKYFI